MVSVKFFLNATKERRKFLTWIFTHTKPPPIKSPQHQSAINIISIVNCPAVLSAPLTHIPRRTLQLNWKKHGTMKAKQILIFAAIAGNGFAMQCITQMFLCVLNVLRGKIIRIFVPVAEQRWKIIQHIADNAEKNYNMEAKQMSAAEMKSENMKRFGFGYEAMKNIKICKKCGKPASAHRRFCKQCGTFLSGKTLFDCYKEHHKSCRHCNTIVSEQTEYCPKCGIKMK